jgi:hypothetical protein
MLNTGLDFAPGTTELCQKLVVGLFTPAQIFSAYRAARHKFGISDLVLCVSEQDPSGFQAEPRSAYVKRIKQAQEVRGVPGIPTLMSGIVAQSAHAVMKLPADSDAMWFIVARGPKAVPVMCVLYATPYQAVASAN